MEDNCENRLVLTVPPDFPPGSRIDYYLSHSVHGYSRSFFQRGIQDGSTLLNGKPCRRSSAVKPGDVVEVDISMPAPPELKAEDIPLEILYEDDSLLIINKQAGLVVHPAQGNESGTLVNGLLAYCDNGQFEEMIDENQRPGIVHRLDKDTSGALIIAKKMDVREKLKDDFREHLVKKVYLGIILGEMRESTGCIELPIGRHPYNRQKMAVVSEGGKDAVTEYRTVGHGNGCSLMMIRIHTGRTHQIRVHFSHFGHPILGDSVYGGCPSKMPYPAGRQMLHAWHLRFAHPESGKEIRIEAPLPADMLEALNSLGIAAPK